MKIKDQISILKTVKKAVTNGYLFDKNGSKINVIGLRAAISYISSYYSDSTINDLNVENIIPLFTFDNAMESCKEKHEKIPVLKDKYSYWWDKNNKRTRISFINWMINKLESYGK